MSVIGDGRYSDLDPVERSFHSPRRKGGELTIALHPSSYAATRHTICSPCQHREWCQNDERTR